MCSKLLSNGKILAVLFYNIFEVKLNVNELCKSCFSRVRYILGQGTTKDYWKRENRRMKYLVASTSLTLYVPQHDDSSYNSDKMLDLLDDLQTVLDNTRSKYETIIIVTKKKLVTPKLVAALDRC